MGKPRDGPRGSGAGIIPRLLAWRFTAPGGKRLIHAPPRGMHFRPRFRRGGLEVRDMFVRRVLPALLLLVVAVSTSQAGVGIGVYVGGPYYRPYYRPYYPYYPYYRPAVIVAPAPVVVAPPPAAY